MSDIREYGSIEEAIATAQAELEIEEAIATAQAELEPGQEIQFHAIDCEANENAEGCTCEPIIVEYKKRAEA